MLSRREKLLIRPWQEKRYQNHQRKIKTATPAVDVSTPHDYSHVRIKMKKIQTEKERINKIVTENFRLLQRLNFIMRTKWMKDFWPAPRPNFLGRQKIDFGRPKTNKKRPVTAPPPTLNKEHEFKQSLSQEKTKKRYAYCPVCSGTPIKRNQIVPEERIPWEPSRKSWNVKIHTKEFQTHKCCYICCRQ